MHKVVVLLLTLKNPGSKLTIQRLIFHTIQLYDLHSFPFNVLTYKAEAILFKVTLELRIDLHKDIMRSLKKIK